MKQQTLKGINRPQSQGNRGRELEKSLTASNNYYHALKIASVWKNPVAWRESTGNEFEMLSRKTPATVAKTASGRYLRAVRSIVDFSGTVRGLAVHFDAKQTEGKSLPLKNIHEHQTRFLCEQQDHGALAGFMVFFSDLERLFFLTGKFVRKCQDATLVKSNRQSIPLAQFEENGREIFKNKAMVYDWIAALLQPTKETAIYA